MALSEPDAAAGLDTSVEQTRDAITDVWGPRTPHHGAWPVRVDQRTTATPERWVHSVCVLCSTGCGLDIGVAWGSQVHAVAGGVVTYAGVRDGYGRVVEIDHGDGYMTRYAHNSKLLAHVGEHVHAGEVISDAGTSGRSTGPHVHFEVWHDGKLMNPIAYVRR